MRTKIRNARRLVVKVGSALVTNNGAGLDKDALATGEGYVNEKTTLWTPCGQLAALGYQVVAVYG